MRRSQFSLRQPRDRGGTHAVSRMRYAALETSRANRPGSATATRLKQRSREAHDLVLYAGERTLVKSVERGEWTTVARFRAVKARHARSATATRRRLRKA